MRLMLTLVGLAASGAAAESPHWPCAQRRVPSISIAAIWPFPQPLATHDKNRRADRERTELAALLAKKDDQAFARIASFAAVTPDDARNRRLTLLFTEVVDLLNRKRDGQLRAIETFARRQRELSQAITADQTGQAAEGKHDLTQRLVWSIRVYDEREKRLRFLCERPTLLEQRAFRAGRAIAEYMRAPR